MAFAIDCGEFCIKDAGSCAASFRERACEARIARCEVMAVAAVECDVGAVFVDLDAEAVEFDLMRPTEAGRWFFFERRQHRWNERACVQHTISSCRRE